MNGVNTMFIFEIIRRLLETWYYEIFGTPL